MNLLKKIGRGLIAFVNQNRFAFIALLIGGILWMISSLVQGGYEFEVPPLVSMLNYVAYLSILIGLFQLFAKSKIKRFASIFVLFILMLLLEVVCFFLLGMPTKEKKEFSILDVEPGHIAAQLGGVPYADTVIHDLKIVDGKTCFDVNYTIDEECIRVTPDFDSTKNEHALFFGCSIAFGDGLEDYQTLAYNFQKESDNYNAYNYAFSGYGTNNMLARLQYQDLSDHVKEENGKAFYVFFWDHIYRNIGAMSRYTRFGHNSPYFTLENGKPVRHGSFKEDRFASKLYEEFYQLNTIKYFDIDFPLRLNDSHYDLLIALIKESKKTYEKQFNETEFYVVMYPSYAAPKEWSWKKFKKMLKAANIKYIDLFDFIDYGSQHTFDGDGHPNPSTSELLGKELSRRVSKMK